MSTACTATGRRRCSTSRWPTTLVLDWTTETLVLRIVQEAVRNVWRHSRAGRIDVTVRGDGAAVEVRVTDDGVGFDPGAVLFESGIAAMRGFAALGQGSLRIESAPGRARGSWPGSAMPRPAAPGRRGVSGGGDGRTPAPRPGDAACVTRTAAGALGAR